MNAKTRRATWWLLAILALGASLRLAGLDSESLWFDEGWTLQVTKLDRQTLWNVLRTQPFPLYYVLIYGWAKLGQSALMLRLFSALVSILALPVFYAIVRPSRSQRESLLATGLLALSPLHIWYAQEARMYALATLLALLATWCLVQGLATSQRRWWIGYALAIACSIYTFYYALFLLPGHALYLLYVTWQANHNAKPSSTRWVERWDAMRAWLLATVGGLALGIPGLLVLLDQISQGTWSWVSAKYGRPSLGDLLNILMDFSVGRTWPRTSQIYWPTLAFFGLLFLAALGQLAWRKQAITYRLRLDRTIWLDMTCSLVPVGMVFLASQFVPAFITRYLVLFLPLYCGLLARGVFKGATWWRWGTAALLIATSAVSLHTYYGSPQKEQWRELSAEIAAERQVGDIALLVDEDALPVLQYYVPNIETIAVSGTTKNRAVLNELINTLPDHQRIWLIETHVTQHALWETLASNPGYELRDEWTWIGIRLALFSRNR